jgi:hypothetical protein
LVRIIFIERFIVKRAVLFIVLVLGIVAIASAQQRREPGRDFRSLPPGEEVTVSGSLIISRGMPAVQSDDTTYLIIGICQIAGLIDGLREGAYVTVDGTARGNPRNSELKFLVTSKVTLDGKGYDIPRPQFMKHPWNHSPQGRHHGRTL